jgi:hypothetical protein
MSNEELKNSFKNQHAELEVQLKNELSRPHPNQNRVADIKKKKLQIKDKIMNLESL